MKIGVFVCYFRYKTHLNWLHIQVSTKKCVTAKNIILHKALVVTDQVKEQVLWSLMYTSPLCVCLGHDVIAQAQSGTGKTATFAVAILQKLDMNLKECQALILAPTRELAQQVCAYSFPLTSARSGWHVNDGFVNFFVF